MHLWQPVRISAHVGCSYVTLLVRMTTRPLGAHRHRTALPELPFSSLSLVLVISEAGGVAAWGLKEVRTGEDQ